MTENDRKLAAIAEIVARYRSLPYTQESAEQAHRYMEEIDAILDGYDSNVMPSGNPASAPPLARGFGA